MADDRIETKIIADVSNFKEGMDESAEATKAASEQIKGAFEGIAEAFGVAFTVDALKEFISSMAELGEQIERTSAILGLSNKDVQELGFIAKITGGSADGMALAMERLQVGLQKAMAGTGPAAAALQALGLHAKDLVGLPIPEQLDRIADAMATFADGGNKTAIAMELFGRAGAQMIPMLDEGSAGIHKLTQSADEVGAVMTDKTVKALSDVEHHLVTAKAAVVGLGGAFVGNLGLEINNTLKNFTDFVTDLTALVSTGHFATAVLLEIEDAFKRVAANIANTVVVLLDLANPLYWGRVNADWRGGIDEQQKMLADHVKAMEDLANKAKAQMLLALNPISLTGIHDAVFGSDKPQAPAMNLNTGKEDSAAKDAQKAQLKGYEDATKADDQYYTSASAHIEALAKMGQITESQKTAMLIAEVNQRMAAETHWADQELAIGNLTLAQYQQITDKKAQIAQKGAADIKKIEDKAGEDAVKSWQNVLQPIEQAFNSQLSKLLSGTESFGQAMKNIFKSLVEDILKEFEKLAMEKLATSLATMFGDPAAAFASASKSIMTSMGQMYAGEAAFFAPALGPGAPAAAAAVVGTTQATAMGMAAFAAGTNYVPATGLAFVHRGEAIVPESQNRGGGFKGGGHTFNNNITLNANGRMSKAEISGHAYAIANALQSVWQNNPTLKPK